MFLEKIWENENKDGLEWLILDIRFNRDRLGFYAEIEIIVWDSEPYKYCNWTQLIHKRLPFIYGKIDHLPSDDIFSLLFILHHI